MIDVLLKSLGYYALFPIVFVILSFYLYRYRHDLKALSNLENKDKVIKKSIKKSYSRIKKLEALFIICIILFIPFTYFLGASYTETMMHREERGGTSAFGRSYPIMDPVVYEIKPTSDLDKLKSKMNETESIWHPDDLLDKINLERLDKYPGKFAAYRLRDNRIIVTFQYISPVPVLNSYGFSLVPVNETEKVLLMSKRSIVFPSNPDTASRVLVD